MVVFNKADPGRGLLNSLLGQSIVTPHILPYCAAAPPATEREKCCEMNAGIALSGAIYHDFGLVALR